MKESPSSAICVATYDNAFCKSKFSFCPSSRAGRWTLAFCQDIPVFLYCWSRAPHRSVSIGNELLFPSNSPVIRFPSRIRATNRQVLRFYYITSLFQDSALRKGKNKCVSGSVRKEVKNDNRPHSSIIC